MQSGLAIIEKTDTETKGFYFDQETIECARLNALINRRIANEEAERRKAIRNRRKDEEAEAKRNAYTINTVKYIFVRGGICVATIWAGTAGMVHPVICIPVSLFCLCTICVKFGTWFGRVVK